jgi:hypothetical protein
VDVTFLTLLTSVVTWLCTSAHWRNRAEEQSEMWRRLHAELLAEIDNVQEGAARARTSTVQTVKATGQWYEGYKKGCNEMIRALAALSGAAALHPHADEDREGD